MTGQLLSLSLLLNNAVIEEETKGGRQERKKQTHISCFLWAPLILPTPLKTRTDLVFYLYMQAPQGLGTREPSKVTNFFPETTHTPRALRAPGCYERASRRRRQHGSGFLRTATCTVCPTTRRPSPRLAFAHSGRNRVPPTGGWPPGWRQPACAPAPEFSRGPRSWFVRSVKGLPACRCHYVVPCAGSPSSATCRPDGGTPLRSRVRCSIVICGDMVHASGIARSRLPTCRPPDDSAAAA